MQVMNQALKLVPNSYPVLLAQIDFLLSKGKAEWARQVAQQAVNSAPSEFTTWAKLAEAHIALGEFDKALLALNSCPMFTFNERDLHRMPTPSRSHLPIKKFIADSGLIDEESARDNEADVALLRLPAPGLRGTFAKAYELLTLLVSKIGWDELLKTRSSVFVMEEEYRQHRSGASVDVTGMSLDENGHADEDASTKGMRSPQVDSIDESRPAKVEGEEDKEEKEDADSGSEEEIDRANGRTPTPADVAPPTLSKPAASHTEEGDEEKGVTAESFEGSAFANKRLCDRWLGESECVGGADARQPLPRALRGPARLHDLES